MKEYTVSAYFLIYSFPFKVYIPFRLFYYFPSIYLLELTRVCDLIMLWILGRIDSVQLRVTFERLMKVPLIQHYGVRERERDASGAENRTPR